jgi:flagellar protein FliJ
MTGFRFRLQRLLDLRARAEDTAQVQLADTKREVRLHSQLLSELQEAQASGVQRTSVPLGPLPEVGLLLNHCRHLARLEAQTQDQQQRLTAAQRLEDEHRQELLQRSQERQVIDQLKARKREQYLAESQRRERRMLEETGTLAHLRQSAE